MKFRFFTGTLPLSGVCSFFLTFLLLVVAPAAHAQWSASDAQTAFSNYNTAFFYNISGDN